MLSGRKPHSVPTFNKLQLTFSKSHALLVAGSSEAMLLSGQKPPKCFKATACLSAIHAPLGCRQLRGHAVGPEAALCAHGATGGG